MAGKKDPSGEPSFDPGSSMASTSKGEQAAINLSELSKWYDVEMAAQARGAWPGGSAGDDRLWALPMLEEAWIARGRELLQSDATLYLGRTKVDVTVTISVIPGMLTSGASARGYMSGQDDETNEFLRTNVGVLTLHSLPIRLMIRSMSYTPARGHFAVIREFRR